MHKILPLTALLVSTLTGVAFAQPAPIRRIEPLKPIAAGTPVTLGRPSDADEVLLRLVGVSCVAATKLVRNADGSFNGSVTCGAVTLKAKRLAIDPSEVGGRNNAPGPMAPVPLTAQRITSGEVTILAIGANDLFVSRAGELVGKVCTVSKPLNRDARGYYAGEVMCGKDRYYFAEVQLGGPDAMVAVGVVNTPPARGGPQLGERWRIIDAGDVYPTINTTDCLAWPTTSMKLKGGSGGWGQYAPAAGDVGQVVGVTRHCSQEIDVALLQIGAYVVPIGVQGIERAP